MICSPFLDKTYATGVAVSAIGLLKGPWSHEARPLFDTDIGHGKIFRKFDGTLLVLYQPNGGDRQMARFFELEDTVDSIRFKR